MVFVNLSYLNTNKEKKIGDRSPPLLLFNLYQPIAGACECHRSGLSSSKVEWEVVSITLVHNFHTQTSAVENVCPGVEHTTLTIDDGLVEVETVQVERHRGDTKCGEPDANNRPCSKEEVQGTGVVE